MRAYMNVSAAADVGNLFTLAHDDLVDYFELPCSPSGGNILSNIDSTPQTSQRPTTRPSFGSEEVHSTRATTSTPTTTTPAPTAGPPVPFDSKCDIVVREALLSSRKLLNAMQKMCCSSKTTNGSRDCESGWRSAKNGALLRCMPPEDC